MTAPEVADQAPDDNKATAPEVSAPLAWNSNAAPGSYPYSPKWNPLASLLLNNKAPEGLDSTLDRQHLTNLQEDIEKLTLASKADISSIYHTVPSLITLFMDSKEPTAQLMNRRISLDDRILINHLGEYTIECLIIHTLANMIHNQESSTILLRLATLIEQIELAFRYHTFWTYKDVVREPKERTTPEYQSIGTALATFLFDRKLIDTWHNDSEDGALSLITEADYRRRKEPILVYPLFDINKLPTKLNLPMLVPPISWHYNNASGSQSDNPFSKVTKDLTSTYPHKYLTSGQGSYLTPSFPILYH